MPKVTVNPLFPMVYEAVRFALSGTKISSEFQVASKLWLLEYDKNQLAQVIENLVINAHQAMPHGGTVQISAENVEIAENESTLLDGGKYVKLEIKDKGIGIPKEQLNRIFDPFYTTKNMGHGLGLTTCYSIITRHGGYIFADSQLGQGTTISIYLPAYIENKTDKSGDSVQSVVGKGLILLMDDEQVVQQTTSMMLRQMGFEVLIMSNGSQVIEYYEQIKYGAQKPVAMIFDLTVPGAMGGKEAIRIIRGMDSDIPVLVSSGYCEDPVMMEPEKYGFNARLNKPFRKKDLEQALNILFKGVNIHQ